MKGIDVYQGDGWPLNSIPAKAYKESDFVIVKATQGVSYKYTSFFYDMIEKTLADKKLGGAYHYAAGNDAVKEADYFISIVKKYIGEIILCLDWESLQNKAWGSKTWCKTFIDRIKEKTGVTCFLYTGYDGMKQCSNLIGLVPLWFAGYPDKNLTTWDLPKFKYDLGDWKSYAIWQFTSSKEQIDRNYTPYTLVEWRSHASAGQTKNNVKRTADIILTQARSWLGCKESDGSHKSIIDLYNSFKPLPRGYKVRYDDSWCAVFISACAIANGYTDLIPIECSCIQMINLAKEMGIWVENENRTPSVGEIISYDWQDGSDYSKTDNKGTPDHAGYVEKVVDGNIIVIEGNYEDCVKRRTLKVNGRYIRGYITPKYDKVSSTTTAKTTKKVSGYSGEFPELPPRGWYQNGDGISTYKNYTKQIIKVQNVINWVLEGSKGFVRLIVDGKYGPKTKAAVVSAQKIFGIKQDGKFGKNALAKCHSYERS